MTDPVRIQLSRAKGFSLQALSAEINGLPATVVSRPSRWGNPFRVICLYSYGPERQGWGVLEAVWLGNTDAVIGGFRRTFNNGRDCREHAVHLYSEAINDGRLIIDATPLRGRNLACWCPPDHPCHADILLKLAAPRCEEITP